MTVTNPQEQANEGWDRILSNVTMNPGSQNPAYLQLLWVVTFVICPPPQGRSDGHNHREKTGHLQKSGMVADATTGVRDSLGLKDLTAEQLQHILSIVEVTCCHGPAETHNTKGKSPNVHWWVLVGTAFSNSWLRRPGISADSS